MGKLAPVIGSSLIGAGASLAGGLFSALGQSAANKHNEELMRMQMDYNSAKSQRSRLEAAGLNPYLMMNGGNAGSVASTPNMQAADVQPAFQHAGTFLSQIPLQQAEIQQKSAETLKLLQDTKYDKETWDARKAILKATQSDLIEGANLKAAQTIRTEVQRAIDVTQDKRAQEYLEQNRQAVEANCYYLRTQSFVQMKLLPYQQNMLSSQTALFYAKCATEGKLQKFYDAQSEFIEIGNKYRPTQLQQAIDMLQKDIDWYEIDKITGIGFRALDCISNFIPNKVSIHTTSENRNYNNGHSTTTRYDSDGNVIGSTVTSSSSNGGSYGSTVNQTVR